MFFWLSKALWTFADPANFLLILAVAGTALMWLGAPRAGRAILTGVVAILLLISVAPVGGYMMAFLEARFPAAADPVLEDGHSEAEATRDLLLELGVAPGRIELETHSRNTYENARFAAEIAHPRPGETWLLATSAFHMPRAMGCFRAAGFPVIAFPSDYRYVGLTFPRLDLFDGLSELKYALHEYTGLIAYRLSGKTQDFLPGP